MLHGGSRSPIRTDSLLGLKMDTSSFDEIEDLLKARQITDIDLLAEIGLKLAELDLEKSLKIIGTTNLGGMRQTYAFRNSIYDYAVEQDPDLLLKKLKELPRGGAQMDHSLYFSKQLAVVNPKIAFENMDDLVKLRNIRINRNNYSYSDYAKEIVKSWVVQSPEELNAALDSLPEGEKKSALEEALVNQNKAKSKSN